MGRPHGASPHQQLECDCAVYGARWGSALTTQSDVMARCGSLPSRHVKKRARGASSATKDAVGWICSSPTKLLPCAGASS